MLSAGPLDGNRSMDLLTEPQTAPRGTTVGNPVEEMSPGQCSSMLLFIPRLVFILSVGPSCAAWV